MTNNTDQDGIYTFWIEYRMLDKFENISSFFRAEVCQVTPGYQTLVEKYDLRSKIRVKNTPKGEISRQFKAQFIFETGDRF